MHRNLSSPTLLAVVLSTALAACDGAQVAPARVVDPGGQGVEVRVEPPSAEVAAGGTVEFAATVTGSAVTDVVWSIAEASGCGTVAAGVYTAPGTARTCHVVATSSADPTKGATAVVTVTAPPPPPPNVAITVSPSPASVSACRTITFSANVTGATDTTATWSVQEGSAGGAVTAAGVYTAPNTAGTYHVVGTSRADPTKTAVSTVTVADEVVSVAVSPSNISVPQGGSAQFSATVTTTCGTFTALRTVLSDGSVVAN